MPSIVTSRRGPEPRLASHNQQHLTEGSLYETTGDTSLHLGEPSDIESVMIDGRFVMRDRKVLTLDEANIITEADGVGRRIWEQVRAADPVTVPRLPRPK